jgi:ribose transport system permease protein
VGASLIAGGQVALGVTAALATGLVCGAANGWMVAYVRIPAFIATYGMLWIAHGLGYVLMKGEVIHGFPAAFRVLGAGFWGPIPVPVLVMLATIAVIYLVLRATRFGRYLYAIGGNPVAARLSGLSVKRTLVGVYATSGLLAAFAGLVVIARTNAADSGTGEELLLPAIAAVCLGGTSLFGGHGGIVGTAVGALILALIVNGMNLLGVATFWQALVMGVIVILAVMADLLMGGQTARRTR